MGDAHGNRRNLGFALGLMTCVPLFWFAPRAPEAPAETAQDQAVTQRRLSLARRDASAWADLYGDRHVPWERAEGHLSIVIDDVGREFIYTERLLALPFQLTFSIVPGAYYTDGVQARARQDRRRYRELMLHLPMEPVASAMMTQGVEQQEEFLQRVDSPAELRAKTQRAFERVPVARGFNNHMGSSLTADAEVMRVVMAAASASGAAFFLDSRTTAETRAEEVARDEGLLAGARDIFLDHDPSRTAVDAALGRAIERAKHEPTVVIAHPSAAVVAVLETRLPEAFAEGVVVYPLSELLARERSDIVTSAPDEEASAGPGPGASGERSAAERSR